jgi:glycine/serine hydroxymethyltransferase
MKEREMDEIADLLSQVIYHVDDEKTLSSVRERVAKLCKDFPLYK